MAQVKIQWLSDSHNCETCGSSYAEGAVVFIDGEKVIDMSPAAHCFSGENYCPDEVFSRVLERLGHTLEVDYSA